MLLSHFPVPVKVLGVDSTSAASKGSWLSSKACYGNSIRRLAMSSLMGSCLPDFERVNNDGTAFCPNTCLLKISCTRNTALWAAMPGQAATLTSTSAEDHRPYFTISAESFSLRITSPVPTSLQFLPPFSLGYTLLFSS